MLARVGTVCSSMVCIATLKQEQVRILSGNDSVRMRLAKGFFERMVGFVSELIFEIKEDEVDGGYSASALGFGIHTQADTLEELRANVKEAVDCYFDETIEAPKIIRLHFVRDEILAR
jgi:predicted RNase H-like HicB family nuclease